MQRRSGEQEGFRTECSTTEQITNLRILYERYLQHQQNLNQWILKGPLTGSGTQRYVQLYNTNANLINIIQQLYDRTSNAVYLDDRLGI